METRVLEYFVAVAEEKSFTRAAERLYVVQSTVSAGIRALESDVGVALFDRGTRRVELTAAGEAMLASAREVLEGVDRMRRDATGELRGRLRVGIFANLDFLENALVLGEFRALHPLIELQLAASPTGSSGLADDVRRGRMDLAFMGLPTSDLAGLERTPLFATTVVAVLPASHEFADQSSVRIEDLVHESFVETSPGFANRVVVERELAARGLARRVQAEVAAMTDIVPFVAAGFGVALAPREMLRLQPGVVTVPLASPIAWDLSIVTRPRPTPAAAALRDLIVERIGHQSPPDER